MQKGGEIEEGVQNDKKKDKAAGEWTARKTTSY